MARQDIWSIGSPAHWPSGIGHPSQRSCSIRQQSYQAAGICTVVSRTMPAWAWAASYKVSPDCHRGCGICSSWCLQALSLSCCRTDSPSCCCRCTLSSSWHLKEGVTALSTAV